MTAKAIAILVALVLAFAAGYHYKGLSDTTQAQSHVLEQEAAQDEKRNTDQTTVAQEAKTYEAAIDPLAPLPAPVVRLCYNSTPTPVPSPHPAGPRTDAGPPLRAADPPDYLPRPGIDIGRPLVQIGHNADAQLAGLRDYIEHVCQAKAP